MKLKIVPGSRAVPEKGQNDEHGEQKEKAKRQKPAGQAAWYRQGGG